MIEEWRDIQGYEGLYQVSNLGRVKSLKRKVDFGVGYRFTDERILIPHQQKNGYLRVSLKIHNKPKFKLIHRLVAEAFIPNPDNLPQVNHKDENKQSNIVDNLEWCTHEYNQNYGTKNERVSKGNLNNPLKSIPVYQFKDGLLVKKYSSMSDAAKSNGFSSSNISNCCSGRIKTYKGYEWKKAI